MDTKIKDDLLKAIPLLRQYAFCLTGSREEGDRLVEQALLELLRDDVPLAQTAPVMAYFTAFHRTEALRHWARRRGMVPAGATPLMTRLSMLSPLECQALLLVKTIGFTHQEAAEILGVGYKDVDEDILTAVSILLTGSGRSALIIEDDVFIASELGRILADMGFSDTATVSRYEDALSAASVRRPDLILADIQLRDSRSGVDTVRDIRGLYQTPVVYVTAFPELAEKLPESLKGGIVSKPFESIAVVKTVERLMTRPVSRP
jgi:CheY-like chemotaxis protein/DNA-directed RNA polymerase specialized sigma24 family protein